MKTTLLTSPQFETMLAFIVHHNQDGQNHIGYYGLGESEIRAALAEFAHPLEESFLLAWDGDALIGVFGADYDPEIDRAWLHGPLVTSPNWPEVADGLYTAIQEIIPANIHEQELFFDQRNQRVQEFAARHGFSLRSGNAVLHLERNAFRPLPANSDLICDYAEAFFGQFERLHNNLFPRTYFTARQIVEKLDEDQRLLLAVENGQVLGYHFCKREAEAGYIDFIGVDTTARGKGLGADLLDAGIKWMFAQQQIGSVDLTVNADNSTAIHLYQKFGFLTKHILCGYRKKTD